MTNPLWQNLVGAIRRLPGVGPKMAERIALYLLRSEETEGILRAVREAREKLRRCADCGVYTDLSPCLRCQDASRARDVLCVIEEMSDLIALERSGAFRGHYHLLGGVLSPLDGIGPRELRIAPLIDRLQERDTAIQEVILATNPTVEGEATASYIAQLIQPLGKRVTRLAYGLPSGSALEYADDLTLNRAFEGRREMS